MGRRIGYRGRPKRKINRYDPNNPDYYAVHGGWKYLTVLPKVLPTLPKLRVIEAQKPKESS